MCHIYYPLLKIENEQRKKQYDHKHNLMILALVSDRIMIPARHLLDTDNDKFDVLLKCKKLFQEDVIYSRIPEDCTDLVEYYNNQREKANSQLDVDVMDIRISKIMNEMYKGKENFVRYSVIEQQNYYSQKIKAFFTLYKRGHKNTNGIEELEAYFADFEDGEIIVKEDLDAYLRNMKSSDMITKETYIRLKKVSNLLYFVAGASVQQLMVCYDSYFRHDCIDKEIHEIISDVDYIINKKYSPDEVADFMMKMGVIEQKSDLDKLTVEQVLTLRNEKCFAKFVDAYEKRETINDYSRFWGKRKNWINNIRRIKSGIVSVILTIITGIIAHLLSSTLIWDVFVAVITWLVTSGFMFFWQEIKHYKIPFIDPYLDKLIGKCNPVSLYLAKVKFALSESEE